MVYKTPHGAPTGYALTPGIGGRGIRYDNPKLSLVNLAGLTKKDLSASIP